MYLLVCLPVYVCVGACTYACACMCWRVTVCVVCACVYGYGCARVCGGIYTCKVTIGGRKNTGARVVGGKVAGGGGARGGGAGAGGAGGGGADGEGKHGPKPISQAARDTKDKVAAEASEALARVARIAKASNMLKLWRSRCGTSSAVLGRSKALSRDLGCTVTITLLEETLAKMKTMVTESKDAAELEGRDKDMFTNIRSARPSQDDIDTFLLLMGGSPPEIV